MRFLMVAMQFPVEPGQSYLTTELADALVAAGHEVEILHLDWSASLGGPTRTFFTDSGVRVVRCAPRGVGGPEILRNASKFVLSGRHAARVAWRNFDLASFDALIAWMPAIAIAPLLPLIRRARVKHRLLFIWDFFPDHHREIGRIPGGLPFRIARWWERREMDRFTAIVCTLPGNEAYLRAHYRVRPDQRVLVTPVWAATMPLPPVDRAAVRRQYDLPADTPIAVFGGQLVEGRGFDQMLGAAEAGRAAGSPLHYLFVGDGRLAPMIRDRAAIAANVLYRPPVTRADYLTLLGACDVGMVATVPGVTSFSIPSKTIDYLRAGLPVVAAVEHGSDFAAILEGYRVGQTVSFGDPAGFHRTAQLLATDPAIRDEVRTNAPRCLDEVFDVRHAVAIIEVATLP
jgi:glycosyltransferase involved in cell wall biosynthesis